MSATTTVVDPIRKSSPDRLHFATGELLGADDFVLEQTYHRRQLAQALLFLHGRGSVGGLRAITRTDPDRKKLTPETTEFSEIHLLIEPGLAIDGAGRLIEVPRSACLRLRRWYNFIGGRSLASRNPATEGHRSPSDPAWDVGDLRAAWRADASVPAGGVVVADVYLAFHACKRGYTPAFSSGPFDSLDASQPSRVRDGYELSMVLRSGDSELPTASDPWTDISGNAAERLEKLREASLKAWDTLALPTADEVKPWKDVPAGFDPSSVLLARVRIPATRPPDATDKPPKADWDVATWSTPGSNIDNAVRNLVLPTAALGRLVAP